MHQRALKLTKTKGGIMPKVKFTIEVTADLETHEIKDFANKLSQGAELNIDENDNAENVKVIGINAEYTQTVNCLESDSLLTTP